MVRRIVIPAAGESSRFGGIPKDLLPIGPRESLIQRAVKYAKRFGTPVIITNPHKEYYHRQMCPGVELIVRYNWQDFDMWGSFRAGLMLDTPGGLILPDTVFNVMDVPQDGYDVAFGVFTTADPWRFSTIRIEHGKPLRIETKAKPSTSSIAWGMLLWSADAATRLWKSGADHYDRALEDVAKSPAFFPIHGYEDLGTYETYRRYLAGHTNAD